MQTLPNGRSLSTARERPRNNEESRMKRFVFKGVLAARTNRIFFWQQRHYADPPERPSYQPHTTEGVISGMKSEQTSRFSVIVRIPTGTPKVEYFGHGYMGRWWPVFEFPGRPVVDAESCVIFEES